MSTPPIVRLAGREFVIVERAEFEQLHALAQAAPPGSSTPTPGSDLPALPRPDAKGNYPAKEYLRASIARSLVRDRTRAGLSQRKLAALAGVRFETICRIETGKHTPDTQTLAKIDRALHTLRQPALRPRKVAG